MPQELWFECTVANGQFSGEYVVMGRDFRNHLFSLFAPEEFVRPDGDPASGKVPGWVRVSLIDEKNDLVLVGLPMPALENGSMVTVPRKSLSEVSARQVPQDGTDTAVRCSGCSPIPTHGR